MFDREGAVKTCFNCFLTWGVSKSTANVELSASGTLLRATRLQVLILYYVHWYETPSRFDWILGNSSMFFIIRHPDISLRSGLFVYWLCYILLLWTITQETHQNKCIMQKQLLFNLWCHHRWISREAIFCIWKKQSILRWACINLSV